MAYSLCQDADGTKSTFRLGQMVNIVFNGLPTEGGKATVHHKNYRRRDNTDENLAWEFLHVNSGNHGEKLNPLVRELSPADMETTARNDKEEQDISRASRMIYEHRLNNLLLPLSFEDRRLVRRNMFGQGDSAEIVARNGNGDSVQRGSLQTLQPGEELNDEIVNYYLKTCLAARDMELCGLDTSRKRSHFFNSFFLQAMFDERNDNPLLRGIYNYDNVRRMYKNVPGENIFALKYIFIPVNLDNVHWTAIVVSVRNKCIRYFDSLGGTDWDKLHGVRQYLKDEAARTDQEFNTDEWTLIPCLHDVPRQLNSESYTFFHLDNTFLYY